MRISIQKRQALFVKKKVAKLTSPFFHMEIHINNHMNQAIYQIISFYRFRFMGMPRRLLIVSRKMLQADS